MAREQEKERGISIEEWRWRNRAGGCEGGAKIGEENGKNKVFRLQTNLRLISKESVQDRFFSNSACGLLFFTST